MAIPHPLPEPDPFDEVIAAMLRDPELIADLDEQHAKFERGELKLFSNAEVRERLRALDVPLLDEPAAST